MKMNEFYCCKRGTCYVYHSLAKKGPWAEHPTSLPKRGVGALSTVTTKERPRHVYNDSKPSKQIIAHKITYNGITSGLEVEPVLREKNGVAWILIYACVILGMASPSGSP